MLHAGVFRLPQQGPPQHPAALRCQHWAHGRLVPEASQPAERARALPLPVPAAVPASEPVLAAPSVQAAMPAGPVVSQGPGLPAEQNQLRA